MYGEKRHNAYTEQICWNGNASDGIRKIPGVHLGLTLTIRVSLTVRHTPRWHATSDHNRYLPPRFRFTIIQLFIAI
jgi:hypothetical protein